MTTTNHQILKPATLPSPPGNPMSDPTNTILTEVTSEVVAAYVAQNHIQPSELPNLIASVHAAFGSLGRPVEPVEQPAKLIPPVSIKKSITDEHLISMEDGKRYKSLKRHLGIRGLTPDQYRAKWGLPHNYPMVAPAYAARRSELAKTIGLGRRAAQEAVEAAPEVEEEKPEVQAQPEPEAPKKPARRGKKAAE